MTKGLIPEDQEPTKTVAVYGGAFKPPTGGHFEVVQTALDENPDIEEFIIFIGKKERDGVTQDQSLLIWEIYNKYLPSKVKFVPSSVEPIRDIYRYAKNNPNEKVLWVIGAREGNEEDFKDLSSRTTSINKYPNIDLRTIITQGGVSGTAARNAAKVSLEKLIPFLPDELDEEEQQEVYGILSSTLHESVLSGGIAKNSTLEDLASMHRVDLRDIVNQITIGAQEELEHTDNIDIAFEIAMDNIYEDPKYYIEPKRMGLEEVLLKEDSTYLKYINYEKEIFNLIKFLIKKGQNIKPLPKIVFKKDDIKNAQNFLGKTGYYEPLIKTITIYTEGRHPISIINTFCHEIIHHIQNLEGRLDNTSNQNILEDGDLEKIEREAYEEGGILLRAYKDYLRSSHE